MGFKLPESYYKKKQEEYDLKYIKYDDKEIHITELENRSVTPEMKSQMRMNSYAQDDLPPKLNDDALIEMAKYFQSQCSIPRFPCLTYNESLIHTIVPELIKRLEEKADSNEDYIPIESLNFTIKTYNALKRSGVNSLDDITNLTKDELENIRNIGKHGTMEVLGKLNEYNVELSK